MHTSSPALPSGTGNAMAQRTQQMLHAPLLPTLFRLATPNVIGLFATTVVIGYDGFILGRLGAHALAGVALVFPLSMLMLQMSAGGIGGAATAAVARALGAGQRDDATQLAQHALGIAGLMAALFMLVLLG
ncbi:MAG TPA: MATE family efflux transporter, partial [Burkholderiaceae bacterium]